MSTLDAIALMAIIIIAASVSRQVSLFIAIILGGLALLAYMKYGDRVKSLVGSGK